MQQRNAKKIISRKGSPQRLLQYVIAVNAISRILCNTKRKVSQSPQCLRKVCKGFS